MAFFLLDTDILALYQHNHPVVVRRMNAIPEQLIGVSVVTYEEQLRGRLDVVRFLADELHRARHDRTLIACGRGATQVKFNTQARLGW